MHIWLQITPFIYWSGFIWPKTLISLLLAHNSKAITSKKREAEKRREKNINVIQIPIPTTVKLRIYVL
jgi:hypothetical protein